MIAKEKIQSSKVSIEAIPATEMTNALFDRWQEIQDGNPDFASPFLGPGYTRLVATCGRPVYVGVLRRNSDVVGFFPFERVDADHGKPVGTIFCDYQAVVAFADVEWDAQSLLRGCNLQRWDFDHLLANQAPFKPFHQRLDQSPIMDLTHGYEAYARDLAAGKHRQLEQAGRRRRQMEKQLGEVSFTAHEPNSTLLAQLLRLKSAQWACSGWPGRFEAPWELALMHNLMIADTPAFGGMLSVLRADGHPVAMHLGLRSRSVWHYWTTVYDPAFARFSPGMVLLEQMAIAAPKLGLHYIDLGKENFLYKRRLMTSAICLAEGCVLLESKKQIILGSQN